MTNKCTKCGLDVKFIKLNGKWQPRNPDGSEHWDMCKKEAGKDRVYKMDSSGVITGTLYEHEEHDSECLPWEDCSCFAGNTHVMMQHELSMWR
jgi:hypothetical protein